MLRQNTIPEKMQLAKKVKAIAKRCVNLSELKKALEQQGIDTYSRNGKLTGAWLGKRKYRLTTLGLERGHLRELTREEKRLQQLEKTISNNTSRSPKRER